jgi:iron uptake system component EfeO
LKCGLTQRGPTLFHSQHHSTGGNTTMKHAVHPRFRRVGSAIAITAVAALLLSACASVGTSPEADRAAHLRAKVVGGASQVKVSLVESAGKDVCLLNATTAKAGPVTFTVTNKSSTAITELELQSDQRILGEKENLAPGLKPVSFTVTLSGGKYQVYCPGAETETQTFTVTGKSRTGGTSNVQDALASGVTGYSAYVTQEINNLVSGVATLNTAIQSGNVADAQKAYAEARPYYERIESDVAGFVLPGFSPTDNTGNLDYLVDMRASNLDSAAGWHGFHAIEKDLFEANAITTTTQGYSTELVRNVGKLDTLSKSLSYKPEDLANGASDLLEEVQTSKISGEEETYSHIDLVDFAANIEGAQQAFAYLQDGLKLIDPTLTKNITSEFASVNALLDGYKDPSALGGYVRYTAAIKAADAPKLSTAVEALHENLARIAEKVATA